MQRVWEDIRDVYCAISQTGQSTKVRKYLASSALSTVLEDFGKVLDRQVKGWKEKELIKATFDKYCVEGSSQQKYWTEESFRKHVRSTTPGTTISEPEIRLLWRSFCYYAYHPVPRQGLKVDLDGFKRAVSLLVFQCDDLIVSSELEDWRGEWEHVWRLDVSGHRTATVRQQFHMARIERIFRSIGKVDVKSGESSKEQTESVLTDAMDILAMCGPEFLHSQPTTEQWRDLARKLFPEGVTRSDTRKEELIALLSLLVRLRVKKEKWGSLREFYNHGEIAGSNTAYKELTDYLANSLFEGETKGSITAKNVSRAMTLMPNFHIRFYQLWAVLFQPPMAVVHESPVEEHTTVFLQGAILLFAPQIQLEMRYTRTMAEKTEEIAISSMSETEDVTLSKLTQVLSSVTSGSLVVFTGNEAGNSTKVVIGAYLPGPTVSVNKTSSTTTKEATTGRSGDDKPRYLLFQLQPVFRHFRGNSFTPLSKTIHSSDPAVSVDRVDPDHSEAHRNTSYRIGKPESGPERDSCLEIDPESRTVRLVGQGNSDGAWYGGARGDDQTFEVIASDCSMEVLAITGGMWRAPVREETQPTTKTSKDTRYEATATISLPQPAYDGIKIDSQELSRRIEGFGSGGKTIARESVEFPTR